MISYQPVWFTGQPHSQYSYSLLLGNWLGDAQRVGQALCYWILPVSGIMLARSTIQSIFIDDLATKEFIDELAAYDMSIA